MKRNKIILHNPKTISAKLNNLRNSIGWENLGSNFSKEIISKIIIQDSKEVYNISYDQKSLDSLSGRSIPIINGIPDFTIFSTTVLNQKERQANYHDDEEINEKFDEVVLRPFDHNLFHAKIWLEHLYRFGKIFETKTNVLLDQLTILNCGCGGGFEAQFFAEQGAKVVGFDISQLRTEAAATRFSLNNLEGFFYRGDAVYLPFEKNTFDMVLYHSSLHHIPIEEIPIALKEACRVTKKFVVFMKPNDSVIRILLENLGFSTSIEAGGNYVFRFNKSLLTFWSREYHMKLLVYNTRLLKMEHRPNFFASSIIGKIIYYVMKIFAIILNKLGNEAIIIMEKL